MRNVVGGLLAVLGAAATLFSPWQPWYNGRHGSTYKFWEVFGTGITGSKSGIMDSVFLIFLVAAALAVAGALMRSRVLVGAGGVLAFGFTILWMIRQGTAAGELTISSNSRGLGSGLASAFGGGLLMIAGAVVMTGRPKPTAVAERADARPATVPTSAPKAPESNTIPTNPPTPSAPAKPVTPPPAAPSERKGTERLSKEERELLGLDQDAPTQSKPQD